MAEKNSQAESSISTSLLQRVKSRDADAWRRLVELFGPTVYQWCLKAGLQPADASDVGQEVFRSVLGAIQNFRREKPGDTFRGWLWRVTQYRIQDHWRRTAKQPEPVGGSTAKEQLAQHPAEFPVDETFDPSQDDELLLAALELIREDFQPHTWQAFWLVTIEGHSAREAADRLNMSRGAVYVAKSRILSRLREELDGVIDLNRVSPQWNDAPIEEAE